MGTQGTLRFISLLPSCLLSCTGPTQQKFSGKCLPCEVTAVHVIKTMVYAVAEGVEGGVVVEVACWGTLWKKNVQSENLFPFGHNSVMYQKPCLN